MDTFIRNIILFLLAVTVATGCSDNDSSPAEPAPRAVLVYMVANNSLGAAKYDASDLSEMATAAKQGDLASSRLFVYHHGYNTAPVLKEITAEGERVIKTYNTDSPSVSAARMNQVINDFTNAAEANARGIILWSHGSGWIENGIAEDTAATGIKPLSFGDDTGKYMNVTTLAQVLEGKGFDYIYFDCCYMAGVEVAYELRHCANRIVASSTELPANGMPYDETLKYLMKGDAELVNAARTTFNHYNSLTGASRTCTISVIDTGTLDTLAGATRAVYAANSSTTDGFRPQYFMTSSCYLFDFGQYVDDLADELPQLKEDFNNALSNAILYKASTPMLWDRLQLKYHSGLSTYLPGFSATNRFNYDNLQWPADVASALN